MLTVSEQTLFYSAFTFIRGSNRNGCSKLYVKNIVDNIFPSVSEEKRNSRSVNQDVGLL